jgi:hypothetical protein
VVRPRRRQLILLLQQHPCNSIIPGQIHSERVIEAEFLGLASPEHVNSTDKVSMKCDLRIVLRVEDGSVVGAG